MAYHGVLDDLRAAIALQVPARLPVFLCSEEADVRFCEFLGLAAFECLSGNGTLRFCRGTGEVSPTTLGNRRVLGPALSDALRV